MTGITYRRIDYWTRTTDLFPDQADAGSGQRRAWTEEEIMRLDLIDRLTAAGLSLGHAVELAAGELGAPIVIEVGAGVVLMVEWRELAAITAEVAVR